MKTYNFTFDDSEYIHKECADLLIKLAESDTDTSTYSLAFSALREVSRYFFLQLIPEYKEENEEETLLQVDEILLLLETLNAVYKRRERTANHDAQLKMGYGYIAYKTIGIIHRIEKCEVK